MAEKDILHAALEKIQQHRYSDSSLYLADIAASLAFGGSHRRVDLSRFSVLDEDGRRIAFDLIAARMKSAYPDETWEKMATRMLETTKGR